MTEKKQLLYVGEPSELSAVRHCADSGRIKDFDRAADEIILTSSLIKRKERDMVVMRND